MRKLTGKDCSRFKHGLFSDGRTNFVQSKCIGDKPTDHPIRLNELVTGEQSEIVERDTRPLSFDCFDHSLRAADFL